jgi:hypothetical protein
MILRNVGPFPNYTMLQRRWRALQYEIQFIDTTVEPITVFAHSNTGIVGSNPTQDMDVCARLFCV